MDKLQCKTCGHFIQHYALGSSKFLEVYCGHCSYPIVKHRKPDAKICGHYIPAVSPEDAFVSKEYLGKALLQKVLDMELLPETGHWGQK